MNPNELAFFTGLFGSIHCIGMCGPLAFAVPSFHKQRWLLIFDKLIYNLGRTFSYTLLGILVGLAGRQLWMAGFQQKLSLVTGAIIMLAAFSRLFKVALIPRKIGSAGSQTLSRLIGYALKNRAGHFITGVLNGLLPCGFVYLALAGALNTGSVIGSGAYMFWFGTGTLPLMLAAMISTGFAGPVIRRRINRAMPFLMLCLGLWFLLRGLQLDIPCLSPAPVNSEAAVCS